MKVQRGHMVEHLYRCGCDAEGVLREFGRRLLAPRGGATVKQHPVHERHDAHQTRHTERRDQLGGILHLLLIKQIDEPKERKKAHKQLNTHFGYKM